MIDNANQKKRNLTAGFVVLCMIVLVSAFAAQWRATQRPAFDAMSLPAARAADAQSCESVKSVEAAPLASARISATSAATIETVAAEKDTERQVARPWTGSATEFDTPGRAETLQIDWVMDALKIGPGSVVADIGAGGGWFTVLAARRVGPKGIVYAEEILPKYTRFIEQRAKKEGLNNVRTILGTVTDPKLPPKTMDAVLILNAYHEFEKPLALLKKIRAGMKPNGRLAFIERDDYALRRAARDAYTKTGKIKRRVDERPDKNPYTDDHRLAREVVEREAASVGFNKVLTSDLRDDHYVVIVTPAPSTR